MDIAQRTHAIPSRFTIRGHNGWVVLGYVTFAVIALAAIYFGSVGPGTSAGDLAVMLVMRLSLCVLTASGALAVFIWALLGPPEPSVIWRLHFRDLVVAGR